MHDQPYAAHIEIRPEVLPVPEGHFRRNPRVDLSRTLKIPPNEFFHLRAPAAMPHRPCLRDVVPVGRFCPDFHRHAIRQLTSGDHRYTSPQNHTSNTTDVAPALFVNVRSSEVAAVTVTPAAV